MSAANDPSKDNNSDEFDECDDQLPSRLPELPNLQLPFSVLLVAALAQVDGIPGGLSSFDIGLGELLTSLDPGIQKAERMKRSTLKEKYGSDVGRFRESTGNVAAIDFGTTFCSLVFTTRASEAETSYLKLNEYHSRVPTAILLKQDESTQAQIGDDGFQRSPVYYVKSFGYEAQDEHCKLKYADRSKCLYFERFKMNLQHDETVHRNLSIKASNGTKCYLLEVIAFTLCYLKDQFSNHLKHSGSVTTIDSFDWVLTVPAIWRSRGKRLMREAAYLAGLCSVDKGIDRFIEVGYGVPRSEEKNPDKLTLALEPEAAAIYCQTMNAQHIPEYCKDLNGPFQSNRYLVIDIGGGTVDITAHHHNIEQGIKVLVEPIGNDCGGMKVNNEFSKLLQKIVNDESDDPNTAFSRFIASDDPGIVLTRKAIINLLINHRFEMTKVKLGSEIDTLDLSMLESEELAIELPTEFVQFYGLEEITSGIAALNDDRIELDEVTIYMKASFVQDLFQPAITGILSCTRSVLDKLKDDIDTIYLVGGFGGCKYIYERIIFLVKANFQNIRVVVPKHHSLAVVHGAMKYRLNPDIIHSRVMDATYGTDIFPLFMADRHDKNYFMLDSRGIPRRRDVFLHYVDKGETISSDEIVTSELVPLCDTSTQMKIDLFSTFDPDAEYIKDVDENPIPTIRKIGHIKVDLPNEDNLPREERNVELTMDFSHTEIQVRARSIRTGVEVKATLDFLTDDVK